MFFTSTGCKNIGPDTLNEKVNSGEDFFLLDVRTPQENATHAIPGSYLIPLQDLGYRMNELPKDKEIIAYCAISLRGYEASLILRAAGFRDVKVLDGGMAMWPYETAIP